MKLFKHHLSSDLIERAHYYNQLTKVIRSLLPENIASGCWVSALKDNQITILVDQSAKVSIIRYQQHEILKKLNTEYADTLEVTLKKVRYKVTPGFEGKI